MSRKSRNLPQDLINGMATAFWQRQQVEYTDTDPHMLYAMWEMESGADPDESLEEVEGAVVAYDKFRPRVSRRRF